MELARIGPGPVGAGVDWTLEVKRPSHVREQWYAWFCRPVQEREQCGSIVGFGKAWSVGAAIDNAKRNALQEGARCCSEAEMIRQLYDAACPALEKLDAEMIRQSPCDAVDYMPRDRDVLGDHRDYINAPE